LPADACRSGHSELELSREDVVLRLED
jgi:hypothetical protein